MKLMVAGVALDDPQFKLDMAEALIVTALRLPYPNVDDATDTVDFVAYW